MQLTFRQHLLERFRVLDLLAFANVKLTASKNSGELERTQVANILRTISTYTIRDEHALNTPEKVEKALESPSNLSDECLALVGHIFIRAGVPKVKRIEISSEYTVNENVYKLMEMAGQCIWPIAPFLPWVPSPVKVLDGQFALVLSCSGCNLDSISHLPSLMSSSLASRLAFASCQNVMDLFKEMYGSILSIV